jgi:hypothetical protein
LFLSNNHLAGGCYGGPLALSLRSVLCGKHWLAL